MSAGYDGNIKLGVSVTADSKSVVAELGALRKQIVDMFSSVDKSLAGGSGSFSNLEKTLSKISADVASIAKAITSLPESKVAQVAETVKEVGTAAKKSGKAVENAFDLDIKTASTEELYQKLKQLRKEAEEIRKQKFLQGIPEAKAERSPELTARRVWSEGITDELKNRGLDTKQDYMPAITYEGNIGDAQVETLRNAIAHAIEAQTQLNELVSNMNPADAGYSEAVARVNELSTALANLNQQLDVAMEAYAKAGMPTEKLYAQYNQALQESNEQKASKYASLISERGYSTTDPYQPTNLDGTSASNQVEILEKALAEAKSALTDLKIGLESMSEVDDGYADRAERVNQLTEAVMRLNEQLGFAKVQAEAEQKADKASKAQKLKDAKNAPVPLSDEIKAQANAVYARNGEKAAKAFLAGYRKVFREDGKAAADEFAKNSYTADGLRISHDIEKAQTKLRELQALLKDADKGKISLSDSEIGKTLAEVERLKSLIAELKQDAQEMATATPMDSMFRSLLSEAERLSTKLKEFRNTGTGFGSMEEAQTASTRLATLTQEINEYFRSLDPAQQKLAEYKQALADVGSFKERAGSGKAVTAEERVQYEAASAKVKEYRKDLASLIQMRNALKSNISQFEKTGLGMNTEELKQSKTLLADISRQCDMLTGSANRASDAMNRLKGVDKAFGRIRSSITGMVRQVGKLASSFRLLGKSGIGASNGIGKSFKRNLTHILGMTFGVRSIFAMFRRLRSTAVESLQAIASQFPHINAQFSETKTLLSGLKGSFGTLALPLITAVLPAINAVISALTAAIQLIARFFAVLSGGGVIYKATAKTQDFAESMGGAGGAAKDAVKSLMAFDELNLLQDDAGGGGGGGAEWEFEEEEVDPNSAVAKFAEMLKQAWATGDFTDVGEFLGGLLRDGLNKLDSWITTEGYALAEKIGNSFATLINGIVKVDGLADSIGRTVADAINMAMIGLHQFLTVTEWLNVGKFVADTVMSFFHNIDWELLGQTVGSYIMAFVDSIYGFITNIDFEAIGQYIATAINNIFDVMGTVDETGLNGWQKLGKSLSDGITGLLEMILKAIKEVDWGKIGQAIGDFIESIDFGEIVWDVTALIANLVAAIAEGLWGWAKTEPISAALASMLGLAVIGTKIAPTVVNAIELFKKFKDVLSIMDTVDDLGTALNVAFGPGSVIAGIGMVIGGAITAVTSFFSMLKNGFSWLKEILMVIGIAIAAVGAIILGAPAVVAGVVAAIVAVVATLVVLIKEHWTEICTWFTETWNALCEWFSAAWEVFKELWNVFWGTVSQIAQTIWDGIVLFFETVWTTISNVFKLKMDLITGIVTSVFNGIKTAIVNVWNSITEFISATLENIKNIFSGIWNGIKDTVTGIFGAMKSILTGDMNGLKSNLTTALNGIKSVFTSIWNGIKTAVTNIANGMYNAITGVMNGIKNAVSGVGSSVRNAINTVIRALNGLHFSIPSWVPGLGGKSFGFNIPYLAQGAVIPPNKEFMAVLGDQKHGTNIEAPLDTIKQAVAEELTEYIDAMMAGFDAVVNAIDNKDMNVTVGDNEIGRAAERYQRRQKLVRGV